MRADLNVLTVVTLALAATSASAQSIPTARPLGSALATSDAFAAIAAVRVLSTGEVLVNDPSKRRIVLLDTMMVARKVVADSTPRYGKLPKISAQDTIYDLAGPDSVPPVNPSAFALYGRRPALPPIVSTTRSRSSTSSR